MANKKLNENLTFLMNEYKIDDRKLAKYTGVSFPTIARLRNNPDVNPTTDILVPIAKYFKITLSQLIGEVDLKKNLFFEQNNIKDSNLTYIPVIEWDTIINSFVLNTFDTIYLIATEQDVSKKSFAVAIPNSDYGLILRHGSIIIIDPEKECTVNRILVINENGNVLICKLISNNNTLYLKPLNGLLGNIPFPNNKYTIIGSIVEIRYGSRLI